MPPPKNIQDRLNLIWRQAVVLQKIIAEKMKKQDVTQMQLSEKSGVPQSTISEWLKKKNDIKLSYFISICKALKIKSIKIED